MKYRYLREIESCEECPLPKYELCNGSFADPNSAFGYSEPPCASWDEDEYIENYIQDVLDRQKRYEEYEQKELKKQIKKRQQAELAKKRRDYLKWYCIKEYADIKKLKKTIKNLEDVKNYASMYSEAVNFTNECFRYSDRIKPNPEIQQALNFAYNKLEEAEVALKLKKQEARNTKEYKALSI